MSSQHYIHTGARFEHFLKELVLSPTQRQDGNVKQRGVRACLNNHYYGISSNTQNSMLVGSWGKSTEVRPPRDIDVLFVLPDSVYLRYVSRPGNVQSQLLQEVKGVLSRTYSLTKMRGDGQVVVVPFLSYAVEVLPAFTSTNRQFLICDTNQGGSYRLSDPLAESENVSNSDVATSGNTRDLIRMSKRWQEHCNVPLKSFWIELLAVDFLRQWNHSGEPTIYYDWMVRDFFKFIIGKANRYVVVPGTNESIFLGDGWKSRAERAYARAQTACDYETNNYRYLGDEEWVKIFGPDVEL